MSHPYKCTQTPQKPANVQGVHRNLTCWDNEVSPLEKFNIISPKIISLVITISVQYEHKGKGKKRKKTRLLLCLGSPPHAPQRGQKGKVKGGWVEAEWREPPGVLRWCPPAPASRTARLLSCSHLQLTTPGKEEALNKKSFVEFVQQTEYCPGKKGKGCKTDMQ